MALAADLSHLPKPAKLKADAWAPDAEPRFVNLLVEQWALDNEERNRNYQRRNRFHLSSAGACARVIALAALDTPDSDPMDLSGIHNVTLGQLLHEQWQASVVAKYPDAEIEFRSITLGGEGSGYADAKITLADGTVIVIEFKSIGGFGFKMAVGDRGAAQGPKFEHVLQGAINAVEAGADELVISYLAKETLSVNVAKKKGFTELGRFCAEWTLTRDEFPPLAAAELARVQGILDLLDDGQLPARKIPSPELPRNATIIDPATGRWEVRDADGLTDTGTAWNCGYCRYQTLCATQEPGRQPIPVELQARPKLTVVES